MAEKHVVPTISVDAFRMAGQDLFPLILDAEKLLHAYGMESVSFISDIFSTTSREKQFDILINTLQRIKETTVKPIEPADNAECADIALPYPIVKKRRVEYNSPESWRIETVEEEND